MIIPFEVDVLKFIQQFSCPALDVFFSAVSMLAEQLVLIAAITYIYWNLNKDAGKQIAYAVFVSVSLNSGLKNLFNFPRPIGIDGIRSHYTGTATGSSFPSGHTQCFSTAAFSLAARLKKRWVYLTAAALTLLVAFSRLYLGVHFPKDVLAGGLLGIIISFFCVFLCRKIRQKSLLYLVSFALMLPFLFLNTSEDYFKSLGLFFGFLIGNFIEEKKVSFSADKRSKVEAVVRWIVGLLLIAGIQLLGKKLLGGSSLGNFLRYSLISLFAIGIYPWIFSSVHRKICKKAA